MAGSVGYIDGASGTGSIVQVSALNPLPVNGIAVTVADFNLNEVAGAATKTGNGTASGAIRVALPTDGTGVVGIVGDSYSHITTATTTTVKNSAGTLKAVTVNTLGTIASTVTLKDNATTIAIIDSLSTTGRTGTYTFNIACATSIVCVTTGTSAPDVTVTYQ